MQNIAQNCKKGRFHWCPQPLLVSALFGAGAAVLVWRNRRLIVLLPLPSIYSSYLVLTLLSTSPVGCITRIHLRPHHHIQKKWIFFFFGDRVGGNMFGDEDGCHWCFFLPLALKLIPPFYLAHVHWVWEQLFSLSDWSHCILVGSNQFTSKIKMHVVLWYISALSRFRYLKSKKEQRAQAQP